MIIAKMPFIDLVKTYFLDDDDTWGEGPGQCNDLCKWEVCGNCGNFVIGNASILTFAEYLTWLPRCYQSSNSWSMDS